MFPSHLSVWIHSVLVYGDYLCICVVWLQDLGRDIYDIYAEYEDEDEFGSPASPARLLLSPSKHLVLNINVGGTVKPPQLSLHGLSIKDVYKDNVHLKLDLQHPKGIFSSILFYILYLYPDVPAALHAGCQVSQDQDRPLGHLHRPQQEAGPVRRLHRPKQRVLLRPGPQNLPQHLQLLQVSYTE